MPLLFTGMVVIVPRQIEGAEQALDADGLPPLADLPGAWLVALVDAIGG